MIKKIIRTLGKHTYLVVIFGVLLSFLFLGNISKRLSFEMVLVVVVFYLISAFVHHHHDRTLSFEVMVEYFLLAGLMLVIMTSFFI